MKNPTYNNMVEGAKLLGIRVKNLREGCITNGRLTVTAPKLIKAARIENYWLKPLLGALEAVAIDYAHIGDSAPVWDAEATKIAADYAYAVLRDVYDAGGKTGDAMQTVENEAHASAAREVGTFVAGLGEFAPLGTDDMHAVFEARAAKAKVAEEKRAKVVVKVVLTKYRGNKTYIADAYNHRGDLLDSNITLEGAKLGAKLAAREWVEKNKWNAEITFG